MAIPVSLGMPAAPPPVLAPRRKTRQLDVGGVGVGSDFPVSVQSMTTTKTADINATLQQIASLVATGVDIVRVAVPHREDAEALVALADLRAGRFVEALMRPDRAARRAVAVVLEALVAEAAPYAA